MLKSIRSFSNIFDYSQIFKFYYCLNILDENEMNESEIKSNPSLKITTTITPNGNNKYQTVV